MSLDSDIGEEPEVIPEQLENHGADGAVPVPEVPEEQHMEIICVIQNVGKVITRVMAVQEAELAVQEAEGDQPTVALNVMAEAAGVPDMDPLEEREHKEDLMPALGQVELIIVAEEERDIAVSVRMHAQAGEALEEPMDLSRPQKHISEAVAEVEGMGVAICMEGMVEASSSSRQTPYR